MIIEWLNPQGTMLFGDRGNLDLLLKIFPEATLINTPLYDIPAFSTTHVDLVCVGSMNERMQEQMVLWLTPYKEAITQRIMNDLGLLWFGNSIDILGHKITRKDKEIFGLNIYSFNVTQESIKRFNALVGIETKYGLILGHKSSFSLIHNTESIPSFGKVVNGFGHNLEDPLDGLHDHHMIASSIMGPLLVLNPHFTKQYLMEITKQDIVIPFEEDLVLGHVAKKTEFEASKHFVYEK
jgi:lipid II isoglutaminyl synthase (glutamine-hydrolysing)